MALQNAAKPFSLAALIFEAFASTMAMMSFAALFGPIASVAGLLPWQVGIAVTIAGLAWMASARWWGALSDVRGRRPVALMGLLGFVVCFGAMCLFLALAATTQLPAWLVFLGLVIGRTAGGFFYAAVPATSAALVSDHFAPEQRTAAMATLGSANGAGMVIGPAAIGLIAGHDLVLALSVMAALPLASFIAVWRALPLEAPSRRDRATPLSLGDLRLRAPLIVAVAAMFCISAAQVLVGFYVIDRLGLSPIQAAPVSGLTLGLVGIGLVAAQVCVRFLTVKPQILIRFGAAAAVMGFALAASATDAPLLWISHVIVALGFGFVLPSLQALAANSVEADERGAAAGALSSAMGLGLVLGPIVGLGLYQIQPSAPYVVMAAVMAAAGLVSVWRFDMDASRVANGGWSR